MIDFLAWLWHEHTTAAVLLAWLFAFIPFATRR